MGKQTLEMQEAQTRKELARKVRVKTQDELKRKIVRFEGIPLKVWASTALQLAAKGKIVNFVEDLCNDPQLSMPLDRSAFAVKVSFSEPRPAPQGCCWVQFTFADENVDMASWLSRSMKLHPKLPWVGLNGTP